MRKKIRDTAPKTLARTTDGAEDAAEPAKSAAGRALAKVKDFLNSLRGADRTLRRALAGGVKTAGRTTAGGAKTAIGKTGSGLKAAGTVAGEGARRAGGGIKVAAGSAATGAVTVGGAVVGTTTSLGAKAWGAMEPHWPEVRNIFVEIARSEIQAAVQDDERMKALFKTVYGVLRPRLGSSVSEEQFIGFCLKHRSRLVKAALQAPAKPDAS